MSAKEALIQQFVSDLPAEVSDFLSTPIPSLQATPGAYDPDNPTRNSEILSHNLNTIFKAFEGLTPVAIPLFIGQLNTVNQSLLLSALRFVGAKGDITIIAPQPTGLYYGMFARWKVEVIRGSISSIIGRIGDDEFDFAEVEDSLYSADWAMPIGKHTAQIVATFEDGSKCEESVAFEVLSYDDVPTVPSDGESVTILDEIQFLTGASTDDITEDVSVSVDGEPAQSMGRVSALGFTLSWSGDLERGELHSLNFLVGTQSKKIIEFTLSNV